MSEQKIKPLRFLISVLPYVAILLIVILIRTFIIGSFNIPSASMENTLKTGDIILVNYLDKDYKQGDIIVFEDHQNWLQPNGKTQYLIKRLLADEGDTIKGENGKVYLNDKALEEPYTIGKTQDFPETTVPKGKMFMMGDNREHSGDSRFYLGTGSEFIDKDYFKGKPFTAVTFAPFQIRNPK